MKNTELFKLLKNFSPTDFVAFEKFLASPFHIKNKPLKVIFQILKDKNNLIIDSDYTKLRRIVKRKTAFSAATITKLYSFLSDAIIDFYKIKSIFADDIFLDVSLHKYLLKNGDFDTVDRLQNLLSKRIDKIEKMDTSDYLNFHLHKMNLLNYSVIQMKYQNENDSRYRLNILTEASEYIIIYSIINLTTSFINCVLTSIDSGKDTELKFLVDLNIIFNIYKPAIDSSNNSKLITVFNLYHKAFQCYNSPADKLLFTNYKKYFETHLKYFDEEIINTNYNCLLNYCYISQRIIDEDKFFYREELNMMKYYINNELYKNEFISNLSSIIYRNYVLLCFDIKDMRKLKWFIDDFTCKLKEPERVEFANYALAHYYYGIKDYQKALKYINSIELDKFMYRYDLLNIEIKIYFYLRFYYI